MNNHKKMWRFPWRYRESLIIVAALILGGFALQLSLGPLNPHLLRAPMNYILAGAIIIWAAAGVGLRKHRLVQWLSGAPLASVLILALLLFSLIMGLTPQTHPSHPGGGLSARLGFTAVTSSWPFAAVYLTTLVALAMVAARRLRHFRRNAVFCLNHVGLWLLLAAAGLGAADRERHVMYVEEGQVEWRVLSDDNEVLELPLAIRLDDFDMEEYPPRLAVIDRESGTPLPEGRPSFYQVDPEEPHGRLLDWDLTLLQYIYRAVPAGADAYREAAMPASTQATLVAAKNRKTGEEHRGWLAAGNRFLPVSPLALDAETVLVMARPEPKNFTSKIKVFSQEGREREAVLEVNQPLRVGHWLIYQYGYDNEAGRMSSYSAFDLVYDPWLYAAYAGLLLWALGAAGLIWQGRGRGLKAGEA